MKISGWIFLIIFWGVIIGFTLWCSSFILFKSKDNKESDEREGERENNV